MKQTQKQTNGGGGNYVRLKHVYHQGKKWLKDSLQKREMFLNNKTAKGLIYKIHRSTTQHQEDNPTENE